MNATRVLVLATLLAACGSPGEVNSGGGEGGASVMAGGAGGTGASVQPGEGGAPGGGAGGASLNTFDLLLAGTRIRARVLRTADGAQAFVGWRDGQAGEDCEPGVSADGKTRCLPAARSRQDGTKFADAGCTVPLASLTACDGAGTLVNPPLWLSYPAARAACSAGPAAEEIRGAGSPFTGQAFVKSTGGAGSCTPYTMRPAREVLLLAGPPEDPGRWAEFMESVL